MRRKEGHVLKPSPIVKVELPEKRKAKARKVAKIVAVIMKVNRKLVVMIINNQQYERNNIRSAFVNN